MVLCKCGCGNYAKPGNRFIHGHNNKKPKPEPKLCACGCGEYVKSGNRFIHGHQNRKPKPEPKPCKCGCGSLAEPGNDYIFGHANKGIDFSPEWRENMSIAHKGVPLSPKHRLSIGKATSEKLKGVSLSPERCLAISISKSGENNPMYSKRHTPKTIKKNERSYGQTPLHL